MEETREEEDEDKESVRSAEAVSPSDHHPEEEDENGEGESPTNSCKHLSHDQGSHGDHVMCLCSFIEAVIIHSRCDHSCSRLSSTTASFSW